MNTPTFSTGDVVQLNSGGPTMTVEETAAFGFGPEITVKCSWFEGNQRKTDTFVPATLKKYTPPSPSTVNFGRRRR